MPINLVYLQVQIIDNAFEILPVQLNFQLEPFYLVVSPFQDKLVGEMIYDFF